MKSLTLAQQFKATGGRPSGFDYLRISLAILITAYHTIVVCYGRDYDFALWQAWNPARPALDIMVPAFFALSGFLVAGSMFRNNIPEFLTLRALRIFPALFCEVTISALIIGPLFTALPVSAYFTDKEFYSYFLNILGDIHFHLPQLFMNNPYPNTVNQQLWTIPYELRCYIILTLLCLFRVVHKPRLLVLAFIAATIFAYGYSAWWAGFDEQHWGPSGRLCVLSFLGGVIMYVWRDKIPHSLPVFFSSLLLAGVLLERMETEYFAGLPIAYVTVWLGLQNPRKIFLIAGADYSYGMYLYGFVIQQAVLDLIPFNNAWYVNLPVSLAVSGCAAYLSWNLLEKKVMDTKKESVAAVNKVSTRIERFATGILPRQLFKAWNWLIGIGDVIDGCLIRLEKAIRGTAS